MDRFSAAKAAVQRIDVIGREFTYRTLAVVSHQSEPELRGALHLLVLSELVFMRGALGLLPVSRTPGLGVMMTPEAGYAASEVRT